jgi:transposase InsO family protein
MFYMKNLFETSRAEEVKQRLSQLRPDSARLWGKMNPAQAVEHCSRAFELALGERLPEKMFFARIIGQIIKPLALGNDKPFRRNSPTMKDLVIQDERGLEIERERLSGLIDRFSAAGRQGCTKHPHSFFGRLTPDEWAILMYKHLDHHLRQFGV